MFGIILFIYLAGLFLGGILLWYGIRSARMFYREGVTFGTMNTLVLILCGAALIFAVLWHSYHNIPCYLTYDHDCNTEGLR